jgi:hypothetical protein
MPPGSTPGYDVQTQALVQTAATFQQAASGWAELAAMLGGWTMGPLDLGLIGAQAGVIDDYNNALQAIIGKTRKGGESMQKAADELTGSANAYAHQEQSTAAAMRGLAGGLS